MQFDCQVFGKYTLTELFGINMVYLMFFDTLKERERVHVEGKLTRSTGHI